MLPLISWVHSLSEKRRVSWGFFAQVGPISLVRNKIEENDRADDPENPGATFIITRGA